MVVQKLKEDHVKTRKNPSDPDPSLFWCNNETAVSGQSLESCKNNTVLFILWYYRIHIMLM